MKTSRSLKRFRKNNIGFTVIELLVVTAIISILLAMLLSALKRAKESTNQIACMLNLREIGRTVLLYTNDYQGFFPPANTDISGSPYQSWSYRLHSLQYITIKSGGPLSAPEGGVFRCPSRKYEPGWNPSIKAALWYGHYAPGVTGPMAPNAAQFYSADRPNLRTANIASIRKPASVLLVGEVSSVYGLRTSIFFTYTQSYGYFGGVHHGKDNAVYVDGHVESVLSSELETARLSGCLSSPIGGDESAW